MYPSLLELIKEKQAHFRRLSPRGNERLCPFHIQFTTLSYLCQQKSVDKAKRQVYNTTHKD
ncbi:MAG: hypothetical protein II738_05070, partial [Clostridia bacterium]|nr:hypothetical protein [Clostridia bacterium]